MKRKFGILILLAGSALLLASCAKEKGGPGDTVTFTVATENATATKAVADEDGAAAKINHWVMEVLDSDGKVFSRKDESGDEGVKTHTFQIKLVKGQTYTVLFWADTKDTYNTADLTNVKFVDGEASGYVANKDSRDAFSAVVSGFQFTGESSQNVTLKRPFAQMNIIFTDLDSLYKTIGSAEEYAKFKPCSLKVEAKVPASFNVQTQKAGDAVTTALNITAAGDYLDNYDTHGKEETVFMDYFFASADSKDIVEVDFSFVSNGQSISHKFNSIPFQRNYRTNIKGDLMTAGATWNVTVDPTWNEDEN